MRDDRSGVRLAMDFGFALTHLSREIAIQSGIRELLGHAVFVERQCGIFGFAAGVFLMILIMI